MQSGKISGRDRFYLEQLFIGELKDESKVGHIPENIRQNMKDDFRAEAEELFGRIPPRQFEAETKWKMQSGSLPDRMARDRQRPRHLDTPWPAMRVLPIAAAAVFAVLVGILATYPSLQPGSDAPVERIKGMEPKLNIYGRKGSRPGSWKTETVRGSMICCNWSTMQPVIPTE
jgi:hypothetical protein